MDKEYTSKVTIKDCPYAKKYGDTLMCMDYVIPCEQNIERNKCVQMLFWEKMVFEQLFERMTDRILYGYDLRYAPVRHLVESRLPPDIKIPKVKFVDVDGTLIQQ